MTVLLWLTLMESSYEDEFSKWKYGKHEVLPKNVISKVLNDTYMGICPPENVKFPGIFNFTRALFKM